MPSPAKAPVCLIIAGPNGAGKTTFASEFLPREGGIIHFVNADLIAAGLAPLRPSLAALNAGRVFLSELDRLAAAKVSFAFESTLSGLAYAERLKRWKARGYRIELVYLRRRFVRSWRNYENVYRPLADAWWLYNAMNKPPTLLALHR